MTIASHLHALPRRSRLLLLGCGLGIVLLLIAVPTAAA